MVGPALVLALEPRAYGSVLSSVVFASWSSWEVVDLQLWLAQYGLEWWRWVLNYMSFIVTHSRMFCSCLTEVAKVG